MGRRGDLLPKTWPNLQALAKQLSGGKIALLPWKGVAGSDPEILISLSFQGP